MRIAFRSTARTRSFLFHTIDKARSWNGSKHAAVAGSESSFEASYGPFTET